MQYIFTAFYKHTDRDFCPLQVKKSRGQTILSVPGFTKSSIRIRR